MSMGSAGALGTGALGTGALGTGALGMMSSNDVYLRSLNDGWYNIDGVGSSFSTGIGRGWRT